MYRKLWKCSRNNFDNRPIIKNEAVYPLLTESGVKNGYVNVTIEYFDTAVERLYSYDNETWYNYEDKKIRLEIGQTIYAKSKDKNGKDSQIMSYTSSLPSDALGVNAYDGNYSTYVIDEGPDKTITKFMNVDSSMQGKKITIISSYEYQYCYTKLYYYNDNDLISTNTISSEYTSKLTTNLTIPENTTKIKFEMYAWSYNDTYLYEITPVT